MSPTAPPDQAAGAAESTGLRAVRNTVVRATGEIVGKLASFVLFAALGRAAGQSGLGIFVFAFAFAQLTTVVVDLGFDRYLLRQIARERSEYGRLLYNVLALKLVLAVPVYGAAFPIVGLLGYGAQTREAVYVLSAGMLIDSLARTPQTVFAALERGGLVSATVVVQRGAGAALGIAAVAAGMGVVAVAWAYTAGAAIGLVLALYLLRRSIGLPRLAVARERWPSLTRVSLPFAVQDVFTTMLFKLDAVILSLMTTEAAVGRYGVAYRLLESTFFITYSLTGAFAAMYTYLSHDTTPSVRAVFGRSIKLALLTLVPIAVAFALLAEPICTLLFGAKFQSAAAALRLLAPAVVGIGVTTLGSALIVGRRDPRTMVALTAVMVALNAALNVALIPAYQERGSAAAMFATYVIFVVLVLRAADRTIGGVDWIRSIAAPLLAGLAMSAPLALAGLGLLPALVVGTTVYLIVVLALERLISPEDLQAVGVALRRRFRRSPA